MDGEEENAQKALRDYTLKSAKRKNKAPVDFPVFGAKKITNYRKLAKRLTDKIFATGFQKYPGAHWTKKCWAFRVGGTLITRLIVAASLNEAYPWCQKKTVSRLRCATYGNNVGRIYSETTALA